MGQILRFLTPTDSSAFDEFATRVMDEAFDTACAELQDGNLSELVREIIAGPIIEAARRGERDPKRLCSIGIAGVGSHQKPASPPFRETKRGWPRRLKPSM